MLRRESNVITRNLLPAFALLLASIGGNLPSVSVASELVPYAVEVERLSGVFEVSIDSAAEILPALLLHRDVIRAELDTRDLNRRLKWGEFAPIRDHARVTAKTIREHLSRKDTHSAMQQLHSHLVPTSIRPLGHLGLLFEPKMSRYTTRVPLKKELSAYSGLQPAGSVYISPFNAQPTACPGD